MNDKKIRSIDIICPLYNAEEYILKLHESFLKQENVFINKIKYILTESKDTTEDLLIKNKMNYKKILKNEFSHSLVRENAVFESSADIIVFVTQDIVIERKDWLENLTKDLGDEIIQTYSRQLTKYDGIEKYTRLYNYPSNSKVVSKDDIHKLGLKTFFSSDASAAIVRAKFVELNGYDQKDLPISEDMYFTYKVIMNNYKVKYCADSVVIHSHNFTLKELYERYKLTGQFMKQNQDISQYSTTKAGGGLAIFILRGIVTDMNIKAIVRYPFDMAARLIGMKVGNRK